MSISTDILNLLTWINSDLTNMGSKVTARHIGYATETKI